MNEPHVLAAARAIKHAVEWSGVYPALHRKTLERHQSEWPTLWRGIDALIAALNEEPAGVPTKD